MTDSEDFKSKTIIGLSWSVVSQIGSQGITFIIGVILARLLSPEEFGLIAMVTIITGFANLFAELGFGSAIIQKKDINEEHLSSVFWLNVSFGLLLTIVFIVGSDLVADFYNEPILKPITAVLAFTFLISSTAIVQRSLYSKAIDFKSLAIVKISTSIISGGIAVYLAFAGYGVWSLVWRSLLNSFFEAVALWLLSSWRPTFTWNWEKLKELSGFSLNLLGDRVLNYFTTNTDDLLIGRVLGSSPLGSYTKAYAIMQMPMTQISRVISRVMFPSFSNIQNDTERIASVYLRITQVIALITFPLMTGLFILSHEFVIVVFGSQWEEMIPLVQIFCVLGMFKSIGTLVGNLYLSQGRADLQFKVGAFIKGLIIFAIIIGLNWGVQGVAAAYTIACIMGLYPEFYYAGKLVGLTWGDLLKNLISIFMLSVAMGGIVFLSTFLTDIYFPAFLGLMINILVGIISYLVLIHVFNIQAYKEVLDVSGIRKFIKNN